MAMLRKLVASSVQFSPGIASISVRQASTMAPKVLRHTLGDCTSQAHQTNRELQLKDPSLFKQDVCYVNGEWKAAKSGKTFKVNGAHALLYSALLCFFLYRQPCPLHMSTYTYFS